MTLDYSQEGLPMEYDEVADELIYKDNRVPFQLLKEAVESGLSSYPLTKNLDYTTTSGFVTLGCLELTKIKFNQLYKQVWKLSKMYNKAGN